MYKNSEVWLFLPKFPRGDLVKKRVRLEEIKRYFEASERLTTRELCQKTSLGERALRNYLSILLEENLIVAVGQTNQRYYQRNYAVDEAPIVLAVLQNSKHVGSLSFSYAEGYVFSYSSSHRGEKFPMLEEAVNHSYALFPFFENLIPESKRRERLLLKDSALLNPLELLLELDDTHGNLDFVRLSDMETPGEQNRTIPSWRSIKTAVLGHNTFVNLLEYEVDIPKEVLKAKTRSRELYSSLSGYQHKIDINLDIERKRIYRADKGRGELAHYLLKPYASDRRIKHTPYLALNEHLCMTFAKNELGLDVPFTAVLLGENRDFYFVTKRYDRHEGHKYNQYDFAQQFGIESEDKYDITLISILKKFNTLVADKKSKENLFRFLVYASLIKHGDFHAKNIGLIETDNGKWALAPLYDIISTYAYEGKKGDDFGIEFSDDNPKKRGLTYEEYQQMAAALALSEKRGKALLKEVIKRFRVYFPKYIGATKQFESDLGYPHYLSKKLNYLYKIKLAELGELGILDEVGLR